MYIDFIQVFNFCSLQNVLIELHKDDPNIFIGINDCGKTSILKCLELLLSEKPKFNFLSDTHAKSDISNSRISIEDFNNYLSTHNLAPLPYDTKQSIIIAKFKVEADDISDENQSTISNHLLWSIENNTDYFILARIFDEKSNSVKDYLLTLDKTSEPINLFNVKQPAITKLRKELVIPDEEIQNVNNEGRYSNLEIIRAIYRRYETKYYWVEYGSFKKDKSIFPSFRYIDWNITLDDLNEFTNEILTNNISTFLADSKNFANEKATLAQINVNSELERFTNEFTGDLPSVERLKANIKFEVKSTITDILVNKINADGDIHLETQGEGLKKQIWFALIKWKSLREVGENQGKKFIWCFDEPENHLYPRAQRSFFEIIQNLSTSNVQTLISTHSTIFIDRAKFDIIKQVDLRTGYSFITSCTSVSDIYNSLSLKNSDFLFFDKFLVYEGDTEEILFPFLYKLKYGSTLFEDGIQTINLGGKDKLRQNKLTLQQILKDFGKGLDTIVFILDSDAKNALDDKEKEGCKMYFVGKQDIEDSIGSDVWYNLISNSFGEVCSITIEEIEAIKSSIVRDEVINSNQKFYPKLKSALRSKIQNPDDFHVIEDHLPSKGKSSGKVLVDFIENINQIDSNVHEAFKCLRGEL
jgi:predicted ATP-dependent endonuclease of OLD family